MRVLVTGSEGFIGSHLVEALVKQGYEVRAFILYNSFNSWGWLDKCAPEIEGKFEIFHGDIRDPHGVKDAMQGCDVVMHLAALIAIPFSYHSPNTYVETNVNGTLNILQAAREIGIPVIHTSTSEVYGTAEFVPITEEHPLKGQSPYSATKIAADQLAFSFYSSFELPVTIIRPFNTYGPRQSARAVIPTIISQLASGSSKIKLGSVYPTRDFNFVNDIVRGFISAIGCSKAYGEVINLGSNFEVSIFDTAKMIALIMDVPIEIEADDVRFRPKKSEVERLWAGNLKAKNLLKWEPKFAGMDGLRLGLEQTINWFTKPENLTVYKTGYYTI